MLRQYLISVGVMVGVSLAIILCELCKACCQLLRDRSLRTIETLADQLPWDYRAELNEIQHRFLKSSAEAEMPNDSDVYPDPDPEGKWPVWLH